MSSELNIKRKFMAEIVKEVPFSGWSVGAMEACSKRLGYNEEFWKIVFEEGLSDVLLAYHQIIDDQLVQEMNQVDLTKLRTHERVALAVKTRLRLLAKNRNIFNKTMGYLSNPLNVALASKLAWKAVDDIWFEYGGDQSTDFNYYSKRTLLLGVYSSSLLYLQSDESEDLADTMDFVDRRLSDVMALGKAIGKAKSFMQGIINRVSP